MQRERRAEWQRYRASSVAYLQRHIQESNTVALLREPPTPTMQVSGHVRETTQKKAMMVMVFLKYMMNRDEDASHFILGGRHALDIATEVGDLYGENKTAVYNAYKEWKEGEVVTTSSNNVQRPGAFWHSTQGTRERHFLLDEEHLKITFKKWMRENLRKLSVTLAWEYLNSTLLKQVDE